MNLKAELRTETGTSASRKVRNEGKVPATLYSKGAETLSLVVDRREFENLLKKEGSNAVFNLEFDGKVQQVLIKQYDKASLVNEFYSIDLQAVSANEKLRVEVPVVLQNVDTVKIGIVDLSLTTILVETTPANIPSSLELDVTGMEIGDVKTVADLVAPEKVEILTEPETTIVSVVAPAQEEVEETEEAAEPEVVGKEESAE